MAKIKFAASYRGRTREGNQGCIIVDASDANRPDVTGKFSTVLKVYAKRARHGDREAQEFLAFVIVEPIRETARYLSWTELFYSPISGNLMNPFRFAQDNYSMVAVQTSHGAQPQLIRPARTTYTSAVPTLYQTGFQIQMDQVEAAGWDIVGRKVEEAGEELARQRDTNGRAAMNTAVVALGGNYDVSSAQFTYNAFRDVVQNSVGAFPVKVVAINTQRGFDMVGWDLPGNFFQPTRETGERLLIGEPPMNGTTFNLMGTILSFNDNVNYNEIWFGVMQGQDPLVQYGNRTAQESHAIANTMEMAWFEENVHIIRSNYRVRRLTIG